MPAPGGNIGTGKAAKAEADGYTILITANNHVINPALYESVPYDPFKDFSPVSLAVGFPTALSVNNAVAAHDVKELVALIRSSPGKFNFASAGVGTPSHLLGEQFKQKLNLDMVHVPYNGSGPATEAVLAGDTQVCFAALTAAAPLAKSGSLRVLVTMSKSPVKSVAGRTDHRRSRLSWSRQAKAGLAFLFPPERHSRSSPNSASKPVPFLPAGRCGKDRHARLYIGWLDRRGIRQAARQ